jgi:hypothetical protein
VEKRNCALLKNQLKINIKIKFINCVQKIIMVIYKIINPFDLCYKWHPYTLKYQLVQTMSFTVNLHKALNYIKLLHILKSTTGTPDKRQNNIQ